MPEPGQHFLLRQHVQRLRQVLHLPAHLPHLGREEQVLPLQPLRAPLLVLLDEEPDEKFFVKVRQGWSLYGAILNLERALAAFGAAPERFHAVIADEMMPGLSGTELARSLRGPRPGLPFILMSGYTGPMLSERALAAGITEVLKKPVQSREIASALARALGRA